jgi:hypothetical protein
VRREVTINFTEATQDEALVVSPRRAKKMLDCGHTKLYEMLDAGELESFKDGKSRKITVASIRARVDRKLAASRPSKTA